MLPKVDKQEDQPERLFDVSFALVQYCSLQRIEQLVIRVGTTIAHLPRAYHSHELDSANAFNELFEEYHASGKITDSREGPVIPVESKQLRFKSATKVAVPGPHWIASFTALEIQPRIAWMTPVVTPKLPWRL
jgi:hypothetical protein